MAEYKTIAVTKEDDLALVSVERPKTLNALNSEVLTELDAAFDALAGDAAAKVVIITGSGEKAFVAGADIAEMSAMGVSQAKNFAAMWQRVFLKIEQFPKPVIAAVNGFALGGGCELAMACDIRIASEKAKFGQPEVTLGIIPGFGGTQRLPRLVGRGMAKMLIYSGDMIDAQEAYRIGLVQKVVKPEELISEAKSLARRILSRSANAVSLAKAAIDRGMDMDIASAMQHEAFIFGTCFANRDQAEGMSAFLEKRKAAFTGREK